MTTGFVFLKKTGAVGLRKGFGVTDRRATERFSIGAGWNQRSHCGANVNTIERFAATRQAASRRVSSLRMTGLRIDPQHEDARQRVPTIADETNGPRSAPAATAETDPGLASAATIDEGYALHRSAATPGNDSRRKVI